VRERQKGAMAHLPGARNIGRGLRKSTRLLKHVDEWGMLSAASIMTSDSGVG